MSYIKRFIIYQNCRNCNITSNNSTRMTFRVWLYLNCTYKTFLRTKWYWFQWFSCHVCRLALLKTIILLIFLCSIKSESFDGQYFQLDKPNFRSTWNINSIKYKPLNVPLIIISRFIFYTFFKFCIEILRNELLIQEEFYWKDGPQQVTFFIASLNTQNLFYLKLTTH